MRVRAHVVVRRGDFELDATLESAGNAVVMGPNGAGKTTLLACLLGALRPEAGHILLDERVLFDREAGICLAVEQRRVAYVPQGFGLFPHLSVLGNVMFPLTGEDRWTLARQLLADHRLDGLADRMPSSLAPEARLRVALARVAASAPDLVLLDEPLAGLDAAVRPDARRFLSRWLFGTEVPAIVVTHDPLVARDVGTELFVLEGGRVVQSGEPGDVAVRPRSEFVAELTAGLIAPRRLPAELSRQLSEDE
ncbi:MAG: ATP-binding cassette domain-containing protein [Sandaracinaceae bacterium]